MPSPVLQAVYDTAVALRNVIALWLPEPGQGDFYEPGSEAGEIAFAKVGHARIFLWLELREVTDSTLLKVRDYFDFALQGTLLLKECEHALDGFHGNPEPGTPVPDVSAIVRAKLDKAIEFLDMTSPGKPPRLATSVKKAKKRKGRPDRSCEQAMLLILQKNPEARGWPIRKWESETKFSKSTIHETDAWQQLQLAAETTRAAKQLEADGKRRFGGKRKR